jgi:membrane protease YdiL (CAAX protease family)
VLTYIARTNPSLAERLIDGSNWLTILVLTTVVSFLTGFGAELLYLRRSLHADGLSIRKTLALNLDSLNGSLRAAFWRALVAFGILNLVNWMVGLLPLPAPHDPAADFVRQVVGGNFFLMAVLMVVCAPFFEELIFRGFLYSMLRKSFRGERMSRFLRTGNAADWAAALLSGLAFALAHMNPSGILLYTAVGVISAELYRRSGSLIPSMLLHAMNNLLGVIALWMSLT